FAQAETSRAHTRFHHRRLLRAKRFQGSEAANEDGRLADGRRVKPFGRAVETHVRKGVSEDGGGLVEKSARGRERLAELAAHADPLSTLSMEQKTDLRHGAPLDRRKTMVLSRGFRSSGNAAGVAAPDQRSAASRPQAGEAHSPSLSLRCSAA